MIMMISQKLPMLNLKPKYFEKINEAKRNTDLFNYPIIEEQHEKLLWPEQQSMLKA